MGRSPRRRRRGPGINSLEIERDGRGEVLDFTLSLVVYQCVFANGLVLAKAAQTKCCSPKQQGGSSEGWGCPWAKVAQVGLWACSTQGKVSVTSSCAWRSLLLLLTALQKLAIS